MPHILIQTVYIHSPSVDNIPLLLYTPGVTSKKFGEHTDMWSFGVTLWELFTDAKVPYKSIPNTEIQKCLNDGLRLEQPAMCPDAIYAVMYKCWAAAGERWTFCDVDNALRGMLNDTGSLGMSAPRDVGQLLNAGYSEKVRRMTASVSSMKRPSAAKRATANAAAARQKKSAVSTTATTAATLGGDGGKDSEEQNGGSASSGSGHSVGSSGSGSGSAVSESIVTETGDPDIVPVRSAHLKKGPQKAVFEELHLSSPDGEQEGGRVRMQSVSLAKRPTTTASGKGRVGASATATSCTTLAAPNTTTTTGHAGIGSVVGEDTSTTATHNSTESGGEADNNDDATRLKIAEMDFSVTDDGAVVVADDSAMAAVPARGMDTVG